MKEKIKVENIISWTNCNLISGNISRYICNISTDSRTIKRGDFFIPLVGENYNGHDFIESALKKGADGFVFESGYKEELNLWKGSLKTENFNNLIILQSNNNLTFLENIAYHYIRKFNPTVIGITGSVGKTITKDFLVNILSKEYKVGFTPGNYNTEIGVSKSILEIDRQTDFFIAELGMRGKGQIKMLSGICNLGIGAITAVGQSHMAFFKDLREIAIAKAEIAEILYKNNGILFLNNDDKHTDLIEKKVNCRIIKFGRNNNITFNFIEKNMDEMGRFTFDFYKGGNKIIDICLNIPSYHNIYNACCAAAICSYLNINKELIKAGIESAATSGSRMEIIRRKDKVIIDDCYNANPVSVKNAINTLVLISEKRNMRSVAILGDMLELGSDSSKFHREIGQYLYEKKVDVLIALGDLAENIFDGYRSSSNFNENKNLCFYFKDKEKLCREIGNLLGPKDLILVKGSRANKMEDIINLI